MRHSSEPVRLGTRSGSGVTRSCCPAWSNGTTSCGRGGSGFVPTRRRRRLLPNSSGLFYFRFTTPEYGRQLILQPGPELGRHSECAARRQDPGCRRQHRLRFGRIDHSIAETSRLQQPLRNHSNPRYVPRWRRHLCARPALGGGQVGELSVACQDRQVGPVHRLCGAWAAGSLPSSCAGPRVRRDVQNLCPGD